MNNENPSHQTLLNRITEMRNLLAQINPHTPNNTNISIKYYPKSFHDCITSNYVLLFCPFVIILFVFYIFMFVAKLMQSASNGDFELTVKSLESNHFSLLYIISFILIFVFFWTFYLFLYKSISLFENISIDSISLKQEDILYFNPCFFTVSMIFYNKLDLTTFFDIFLLLSYSSVIFANFLFCKYGTYYFNSKVGAITNIMSKETSTLFNRMKVFFSGMIFTNIMIMSLIGLILPWDHVEYSILIIFRSVYLFFHQIQMRSDIWLRFKQLDSAYCTNEKKFIHNQYFKLIIEALIQIAVIQQLFFANIKLYRDTVYLAILSWSVILRGIFGMITIGVKFFELSAFLTNLELK